MYPKTRALHMVASLLLPTDWPPSYYDTLKKETWLFCLDLHF